MSTSSMKSLYEVKTYLSSCAFVKPNHRRGIRKFLKENAIENIRFNPNDEKSPELTTDHFVNWFKAKLPHKGDFISFYDTGIFGIVQDLVFDGIVLAAYRKGDTYSLEPLTVDYSKYRNMNEEELISLQNFFFEENISWNRYYRKIVPRIEPCNNSQVRITRLGKSLGYGVFKEKNASENVVFYCLKYNGEQVDYSLHINIGIEKDFQFETMTVDERKEFSRNLEESGLHWNGYQQRIEPAGYRMEGQTYYYVTESWKIKERTDQKTWRDDHRFNAGNYFTRKSNALLFIEFITKKRKDIFKTSDLTHPVIPEKEK